MYENLMAATQFKMRSLRREVETYLPALLPNEVQISDINGLWYLKLTEDTNWYEFDRAMLNRGTDTTPWTKSMGKTLGSSRSNSAWHTLLGRIQGIRYVHEIQTQQSNG